MANNLALIDPQKEAEAQAAFNEALNGLVLWLQGEADDRVTRRKGVENIWLADLLQYHSTYDAEMEGRFNDPLSEWYGRSRVFIGKTREKTNGMIAKVQSILFPIDEDNWSIEATPVPEMERAANETDENGQPTAQANQAKAVKDEAGKRAEAMADEIRDQLEECGFISQCRDIIEDACKIGTGALLGPMVNEKSRKKWAKQSVEAEDGTTIEVHELVKSSDPRPAAWRLDPWNLFPSSDSRGVDDSDGFFVRHIWTQKQLRAFKNVKGVMKDNLRKVHESAPKDAIPDYLNSLRSMGVKDQVITSTGKFYTVWQYLGPVTAEQMKLLAVAAQDEDTFNEVQDIDPLDEVMACVWFCNGTLLKFDIYPLDSCDPLVSVFRFEKEEGSFWGYGIPRIMRDDQSIINSSWRMIMDNADLATGGLIVIDSNLVRPTDGSKRLYGRKIFEPNQGRSINDARTAIAHIDIPMRQGELVSIIELAARNIDQATSQPNMNGDGERMPVVTQTAQGTALWLNSFNVLLSRVIKNFDDDLTVPTIERFYDWNMQFSQKEEIKGDLQVKARGSSALLVRELQAQNILTLALAFGGHPVYGPYHKDGEAIREVYRAHSLDPDKYVRDDEEAQEIIAQQAEAAAEPDDSQWREKEIELKQYEIDTKAEMSNMENDTRRYVADKNLEAQRVRQDTEMMKVAEDRNDADDERAHKERAQNKDIQAKERSIAAEAGLRQSPQAPLNQTQVANS